MLGYLLLLLPAIKATVIPRDLLFSDPKYSSVALSPDGRFYAYIAPDEKGIRNVYTQCVSCRHKRKVTFEKDQNILSYMWTGVPDIILYTQDNNGDENTRIYKKNISQAAIAEEPMSRFVLSDRAGVKGMIMANNYRDSRVLVGLNDEIPAFHNVYSFDLITNKMELILKNKRFPMFVTDNELNIRLASEETIDGKLAYYKLSPKANPKAITTDKEDWIEYLTVEVDDKPTTFPVSFDATNRNMYWLWGEGTDLGTLIAMPFDRPTEREVLYTATRAQIGNILLHPMEKTLLAVTEVYHKPELYVANETYMEDLQYLVNLRPQGSLQILSLSLDMHTWLVTYLSADKPYEIFIYRRWLKSAELLFNLYPELEKYELNKMIGFDFLARDNQQIQAYISLPPSASLRKSNEVSLADKGYAELGMIPAKPQKLIIMPHGGPKARDVYGFSPINAFLTNRGYAVLQVNFRGSTGFGKKLTNLGNGEWGRKMHYDLLDALEFSVAKGIADRNQIAIMGGSYGGYAALVGLTFTPDTFACGIDIFGPSNLVSLLEAVPPYWLGFYQDLVKMVGADIDTEAGKQSLKARSPLFFADRIKKPIMIHQGANDPRVKQQESDQFVTALQKNQIPVTYVVFPDEGHGFSKVQNRLTHYGHIEKFLHSCLGGEYEPFENQQYNSSATVRADGYAPTTTTTITTAAPSISTIQPQFFFNRPFIPAQPQQPVVYNSYNPVMAQQAQQRPAQYQQPYARPAPHLQPPQAVIARIFPYQG
ncbi:hypothetical protein WR25_07488 [Diploscapter pachys]|uniref:Peptidase S9 prolyl oligopeptidase catalytic domain-containing protein n=1 Tax=Diploscapter pachys TaxID=2018661 RepID=A0A2A2JKK7_9BILA|nr:hypothetical protein WR25_07488 [Diploscapter pachys]